ncbi:MAG TPA: sulfatase-like hydrolase/transferase [bacterium]|nr:sulfatase-like hydrolase/transferase [bacterium]
MNRRNFLKKTGIAAGLFAFAPWASLPPQTVRKPNILFLFADDQCYEALSALGSEVRTPNLDRLVGGGVTFTHAFNQGAWHGAVCVASRTMLVTGRFLWHAKAIEPHLNQEREAARLWPQLLERAGYDTYMSGKWHVKVNAEEVFRTTRHIRPGMPNQTEEGYNRPVEGEPDPWDPWDTKYGGYWEGGKHWSEVLGDDATDFLQRAAARDNPFFMYLAFNAPHDPRQSPREYVDMYPPEEIDIPVNYLPEYPYKDFIGCGEDLRDERLAPFPRTKYAVRVHRQEYYAIISHMDSQIGRILEGLNQSGKAENTSIFFTADHGLAVGHHGLMGKQNMFDHSVRAPLIVSGPDIPQNLRINTPVYLQDIMPSTLDLAGVRKPEYVQFKSLLPLIRGEQAEQYRAIYGGYIDLQRMVRKGRYKLIYYPEIDETLLFDLRDDPYEMYNLAKREQYSEKVGLMQQELRVLQKAVGDTLTIQ